MASGSHEAASNLGQSYMYGIGVKRRDPARAIRLFRKAAAVGIAETEFNLGYCYEMGQGVRLDLPKAVRFYRMAAPQGDAAAQSNLGTMYLDGRGVPRDANQARSLFLAAAEAGNSKALINLADMYDRGNGAPRDEAAAYKWLELARRRGESVDESVRTLASRLTASEIEKAEQQADGWAVQHARVMSANLGQSF